MQGHATPSDITSCHDPAGDVVKCDLPRLGLRGDSVGAEREREGQLATGEKFDKNGRNTRCCTITRPEDWVKSHVGWAY